MRTNEAAVGVIGTAKPRLSTLVGSWSPRHLPGPRPALRPPAGGRRPVRAQRLRSRPQTHFRLREVPTSGTREPRSLPVRYYLRDGGLVQARRVLAGESRGRSWASTLGLESGKCTPAIKATARRIGVQTGRQCGGTDGATRQYDAEAAAAFVDCLDLSIVPAPSQTDQISPLVPRTMSKSPEPPGAVIAHTDRLAAATPRGVPFRPGLVRRSEQVRTAATAKLGRGRGTLMSDSKCVGLAGRARVGPHPGLTRSDSYDINADIRQLPIPFRRLLWLSSGHSPGVTADLRPTSRTNLHWKTTIFVVYPLHS